MRDKTEENTIRKIIKNNKHTTPTALTQSINDVIEKVLFDIDLYLFLFTQLMKRFSLFSIFLSLSLKSKIYFNAMHNAKKMDFQ